MQMRWMFRHMGFRVVGLYRRPVHRAAFAGGNQCVPRTCDARGFARLRRAYSAIGDASRAARLVTERLPQGCLQRSAPPSTSPPVSTPPRPRPWSGDALPRAPHVPPSWVLTTLTVCSTGWLVGLLHPTADPGVHRVSTPVPACRPWCRSVPTDAMPSRAFPSSAAVLHVTVGRAPLPLPRTPLGERSRLRGLHPRGSPWPCRDVAAVVRLEALLGFPHLETCRRSPARPCRSRVGGLAPMTAQRASCRANLAQRRPRSTTAALRWLTASLHRAEARASMPLASARRTCRASGARGAPRTP